MVDNGELIMASINRGYPKFAGWLISMGKSHLQMDDELKAGTPMTFFIRFLNHQLVIPCGWSLDEIGW